MKTIPFKTGVYVETPSGADYFTCPLCNHCSDTFTTEIENNDDDDEMYIHHYCLDCNIIFDTGCEYIKRGCTDSTYNTLLVKEFEDVDGNKILGMPVFDSYNEMQQLLFKYRYTFACTCGKIECDV